MAAEIIQDKETQPVIRPPALNSTATGSENIAKVLGQIAERSMVKATDYATEASKTNLLQTHSMIQDVEAQSKIDIVKSPEHAETIAKNAEDTITKIKSTASLNRADRVNLDSAADSTLRNLNLTAAQKAISLSREQAKFSVLSAFGDTLSSIRKSVLANPEQADALIQDQYTALAGQVKSGIITAVEAANIHKQLTAELQMAHELVEGIKSGVLDAADVNTYHATDPAAVPMSNAGLPIDHHTVMNTDHYFGQLTHSDIQSRIANGERVSPADLTSIKKISDLDKILNYGAGAARATGEINAGTPWPILKTRLEDLKKKDKLSSRDEGYKHRLNNFFVNAEKPGAYQNYIAGMPEGARAWQDYTQKQAAIDKEVLFGTVADVSAAKAQKTVDNLNELISKSASIGIGMNYPDHLRQPIPLQILMPIMGGFEKDGDVVGAIKNMQMLDSKNRMYAMNAFPKNPRKQLTVYEIGNLSDKADQGFLIDLMQSQQVDALGKKADKDDSQEKFMQLAHDKTGYSDQKLIGCISASLGRINTYLRAQPNGGSLVSAKTDQALRYIKKVAADHNDYTFSNLDEYLNTYTSNMEKAYEVSTGFNYVMDSVNVPLEDDQKQILASHGLNEVRQKLLEYRTPSQVDEIFSQSPPIMASSPGGRITVIFPNGSVVPDKNGEPAYDHVYTESVWRKAEADHEANAVNSITVSPLFGSPTQIKAPTIANFLRSNPKVIRPVVEGNIDLENRPKVWDDLGRYQTIKTITREFDGKTVLIPTIVNGKELSVKDATEHYLKTGEHLGIFKNREDADKYDKQLHQRMGWLGEMNKWEGK